MRRRSRRCRPAATSEKGDHDDADLQRPAKRERTGAPDASSEKAPAGDASSEKAPAADTSSENATASITIKTMLDMFPLETIAGGIIAVEPDEWIELESCVPLDFDLKNTKDYFSCYHSVCVF